MTNLIDRLERKGFVRRTADTRDGRRILVEPGPDRIAADYQMFASTRQSLARLYERYSDGGDLAVIADFLARNADRLRKETARLTSEAAPGGSEV